MKKWKLEYLTQGGYWVECGCFATLTDAREYVRGKVLTLRVVSTYTGRVYEP